GHHREIRVIHQHAELGPQHVARDAQSGAQQRQSGSRRHCLSVNPELNGCVDRRCRRQHDDEAEKKKEEEAAAPLHRVRLPVTPSASVSNLLTAFWRIFPRYAGISCPVRKTGTENMGAGTQKAAAFLFRKAAAPRLVEAPASRTPGPQRQPTTVSTSVAYVLISPWRPPIGRMRAGPARRVSSRPPGQERKRACIV